MVDQIFEWKSLLDNWIWFLSIPVGLWLFYLGLRKSVSYKDSNAPKGRRVEWSQLWKRK